MQPAVARTPAGDSFATSLGSIFRGHQKNRLPGFWAKRSRLFGLFTMARSSGLQREHDALGSLHLLEQVVEQELDGAQVIPKARDEFFQILAREPGDGALPPPRPLEARRHDALELLDREPLDKDDLVRHPGTLELVAVILVRGDG